MALRELTGLEVFRPEYKELDEQQKALVLEVKTKAGELFDLFSKTLGRETAVAKTNLEQAVMWAVKGITA